MAFWVFVALALAIWALSRSGKAMAASADAVEHLADRIARLEKRLEDLREKFRGSFNAEQLPSVPEHKKPPEIKELAEAEKLPETTPEKIKIPPPPAIPTPAPVPEPKVPAEPVPVAAKWALPEKKPAPPVWLAIKSRKEALLRLQWADVEEKLGTDWLNKFGIVAFVIGFAFLLNYSMAYIGPAGKIALGYLVAAILLGLGVYGERRERYRFIARVVLGGGWAVAYFTTYAMHNIEAVRVVQSAGWGFFFLFVVAAAMVAHSLRYNSQVATGFAYMLAYASVAISQITVGALVASALLTASLVVVLWKRRWYQLEPWAVLATYGLHWFWLRQLFGELGGKQLFEQYPASLALLTVYWVIFTVSHFLRDEKAPGARTPLILSFLANAGMYLAVLRYQSQYPELRFWFLLGLGAIYLVLAAFSWRAQRRLAFLLTSTLGAGFVFIILPDRFADTPLEYIWLVEAEVLLVLGWRLADAHLRKLGWVAAGVLAPYVFYQHIVNRVLTPHPTDVFLGWLLLGLAAAYLANALLAPRLLGKDTRPLDDSAAKVSSLVGTAILLTAVWVALPTVWVAPVWALVALALAEAAPRLDHKLLRACGHATAALVIVRLVAVNLSGAFAGFPTSLRLVTVTLSIAVLFLAARRVRSADHAEGIYTDNEILAAFGGPGLSLLYTGASALVAVLMIQREVGIAGTSLTLAVLVLAAAAALISYPIATGFLLAAVWVQAPDLWVAPIWILVAFALREIGRHFGDRVLRACGHGALLLTAARLAAVNLLVTGPTEALSLRLVTVTLSAVLFYIYVRRIRPPAPAEGEGGEWLWAFGGPGLAALFTWAATLLAAVMIWQEFAFAGAALIVATLALTVAATLVSYPIATGFLLTTAWVALLPERVMWVAPVWILLASLLYELGFRRGNRILSACGHGTVLLVVARLLAVNFPYASPDELNLRLITVGFSVALLYYYTARMRRSEPAWEVQNRQVDAASNWAAYLPALITWSSTILAGLLVWYEATTASIALAWGILGLALLEVGRAREDRPLLTQGYTLLFLSFGRIFIADLNASGMVFGHWLSARLVTISLLAVIYYYAAAITPETFRRMRNLLLWFAMAALAALIRFEMNADWVVVGWATLAAVLYLLAGRLALDTFRYQTYLMVLLVAARSGFDNLFQTGGLWNDSTNVRTATIVAASLLIYLLLVFVKFGPEWLRESASAAREVKSPSSSKIVRAAHWFDGRPQHLFFFAPTVLLTVLMSLEIPRGYLTAAWGLEGVLLFIVALRLGERAFRWYSLLLLLMCIGKIVSVDVWVLEPLGRIVSLMGLGAALLVVSFLYTRYREAWRKYL